MLPIFTKQVCTKQPTAFPTATSIYGQPSYLSLPKGIGWYDVINENDIPWTVNNSGSLSTGYCPGGKSIVNSSTGYFSRTNPVTTGPITVVIVFTPTSVTGGQGIWSIATTAVSSSPHTVLQRNGSDIRLWWQGSYRITFTGIAAIGKTLNIVLTFDTITDSTAQSARLAVNGTVQSAFSSYVGNQSKTNEYLGSGYSTQAVGHISLYGRFNKYLPETVVSMLSTNPWQLFQNYQTLYFAPPSTGDATASGVLVESVSALIAGSATGEINSTAPGVTIDAVASIIPGTASGGTSATANGVLVESIASFIAGSATGIQNATATGVILNAIASLLGGSATGNVVTTPTDNGKIHISISISI